MKKLSLTLLLLYGLCGFAQTGFIEVEVTDTVWMKPVSFDYNVVLNHDISDMYSPYVADSTSVDMGNYNPEAAEAGSDKTVADLKAFLSKKGYATKPIENQGPNIFTSNRDAEGFVVTVTSTEKLEALKAEVKELGYAEGSMGAVNYGDSSAYDARIYKKLIEAARKKAGVIAGLSGQKLGKVIEVKEPSTTPDGVMEYMVQLRLAMGSAEKLNRGADNNLYGEMSKTLMVKFAAK